MSDPYAPRRVCVTVKVPESKRYAADNPWLVFEGDVAGVRGMIGEAFGLDTEGLSLADVTINAQHHATALGNVSHTLGASVIAKPAETPTSGWDAPRPVPQGGDVWAAAQAGDTPTPPAAEEAADPILAAIENAKSVDELKQLWAENQSAFADAKYMDPWKAKGKALTS